MQELFPIDIGGVKKKGAETWLSECPYWPVADAEYMSLCNEIDQMYLNIRLEASPEIEDVLFALFKLTTEYATFVQAGLVVERLRKKGFEIDCDETSDVSGYYNGFTKGENHFRGRFRLGSPLWPSILPLNLRVRRKLGAVKNNIRYYGSLWQGLKASLGALCLTLNFPSPILKTYAASQCKDIGFRFPLPVFLRKAKYSEDELRGVTDQLINGLERISEKHGTSLHPELQKYLNGLTYTCLADGLNLISHMHRYLNNNKPDAILSTGLGNTFLRCLLVAAQRQNVETVGLTHGDTLGLRHSFHHAVLEVFSADTYLVPTRRAIDLWAATGKRYEPLIHKDVNIVSYDTDIYEDFREKNRKTLIGSSIRRVMFLEYPMSPIRHPNVLAFWPYQLDFILRLSGSIQKLGIQTIMKRHPEFLPASENIYDDFFDETIGGRFEDLYDMTDAFLFTNISTTTFYSSLLTNKPVILFDFQFQDFVHLEAEELLRKRSYVVPSWFNNDGQIMYDEDVLAKLLMQPPTPPNDEFVNTFMLS